MFASIAITTRTLRKYCGACHAVGALRFIHSENDDELWSYILTHEVPETRKLWAQRIYETLNWPSDSPPPFGQLMEPPLHDWMPKGVKRLEFASDKTGSIQTRRIILETILSALP